MHERQDLGEARGKSETEKARQNLESEVLVQLNGLSEMSGLRPRSRDGRKSRTVTYDMLTECRYVAHVLPHRERSRFEPTDTAWFVDSYRE